MSDPLHSAVRRASRRMIWDVNARTRKRVIAKFVAKVGLVYFGTVNQHTDNHKVVRGFTISSSHLDNHYCVGSIAGYNVTLVDRSDAVRQPDDSIMIHNWLIVAFDLHTKCEIPHVFIRANKGTSSSYASLFVAYPALNEVVFGTFENYSSEFTNRFTVYTKPSKSIEIERLFPAESTSVMAAHLWPFSAEQHENILYVYADNERVTPNMLDTMLENGLWLAGHLDSQAELV